ncbi:MAG TPA: Xaa-Pro peptidase family protein [Steroidobacteraceae bacterium]|nr:Xaa-Pro peptidase family protein [Steroidobacteraceae bacterium]
MGLDLNRLRLYRRQRVQGEMRARNVQVLLLMSPLNVRYATGATIATAYNLHAPFRSCLLPVTGPGVLFDWGGGPAERFDPATISEVRDAPLCTYFPSGSRWQDRAREFAATLAALARDWSGEARIAIDTAPLVLIEALRTAGVEWTSAEELIHRARSVKSVDEIACIEQSMALGDTAIGRLRDQLCAGMTERELWSILAATNAAAGGDFIDYPLLLSGEHIIPWGEDATDRRVAQGELVAFDLGMMGPTGYKADVSRTLLCPPAAPTARQRLLYHLAHEQLEHNLALIRPGASFREVSRGCWPIPAGYQKHRYPMMIHGVGLSNEWQSIPYDLDWDREGSEGELETYMVLAVESMVAEDAGGEGVKLEDMVVVENDGSRRLSLFPFEPALLAS